MVAIKCAILVKQLHTTSIESNSCARDSLVMKLVLMWFYGFVGVEFGISFFARVSIQFLFLWY